MKIAGSKVEMDSQHVLVTEHCRQEAIRFWQNGSTADGAKEQIREAIIDQLKLSDEAMAAFKQENPKLIGGLKAGESQEVELTNEELSKITLLEKMLSFILGREFKFKIPRKIIMDDQQQPVFLVTGNNLVKVGWGFAYDYHETYRESEKMTFNTKGVVQTADGRMIDFQLSLSMSREFFQQTDIQIRAGAAQLCDPLVMNLEGLPASLTDVKFSFDLDCDGVEDQISFTNAGSGFLAIDLNNDGKVNDGAELFGPETGNGFKELAKHDQDQNGWIDENDAVFERLRIWTKDQNGSDQLFALGEKGVGAIYLGNVSAQFGFKNNQNELLGQAQTAGVFLKEDGTPGIVQQIDLVV